MLSEERRLSLLALVHLMEQSTSGGDYSLPAVYFGSPAVPCFDFRETLTRKHIIRHAEGIDSLAHFLSYPHQGNHQHCHSGSNQFKEDGVESKGVPLLVWGTRMWSWRRPAPPSRPMTYVNPIRLTVRNAHKLLTKRLYEYIHRTTKEIIESEVNIFYHHEGQ